MPLYRCSPCNVTYSSGLAFVHWPPVCPRCLQATLAPRQPADSFDQGDVIVPIFGAHVPVNPLVQMPVVVPAPTHPAWFSVPRGDDQSLSAAHKLTRPGVPLLGTFHTRAGTATTRHQEIRLHRPAIVPAAVRKLAITADADALAHLFIDAAPGQTAADFTSIPYAVDPDSAGYERNGWFSDVYDQAFREYRDGTGYELYRAPVTGRPLRLRVCARGLPGWPLGARQLPPAPPGVPYDGLVPQAMARTQNVYPARGALELWLTLRNEQADATLVAHDVALFTQAPFIITSEIDPPERLFAVLMPDTHTENVENVVEEGSDSDEEEDFPSYGNFGTIADLCGLAAGANVPVTLLSGADTDEDVWAQDAVLLGSMHVPRKSKRAVVATNRRRNGISKALPGIEARLQDYQPDDETGLFEEILTNVAGTNSLDYGGNVIATPPIAQATQAIQGNAAGPAVAAHPPAPYGKLIVGDHPGKRPTQEFREWLHAQKAQPVLPINTAWLSVGHVDEILAIVPAPATERGWAVLFADPDLALRLHRVSMQQAGGVIGYRYRVNAGNYTTNQAGIDPVAHRWKATLVAIRARLAAALDLQDADFVSMPVLYSPHHVDASAVFPNLVNGLTLGTFAVLPRPYGPRITLEYAQALLTQLPGQDISEQMVDDANLGELLHPTYWARKKVDDETFRSYFAKNENEAGYDDTVITETVRLLKAGAEIPPEIRPPGIDRVPNGWSLWSLTMTHVDIYEAYVKVRLSALGLQPFFVDNWAWYHSKDGELHCGTKVRRKPHVPDAGSRWWEVWPALLGVVPAAP